MQNLFLRALTRTLQPPGARAWLAALAILVSVAGGVVGSTASPATAASSVANAAIADKALAYVTSPATWGAKASVDAGWSGFNGSAPALGNGNNPDGECRAFVNAILKMVTGINTAYGPDDYQRAFRENGGQPISLTGGLKGDIIQWRNGGHTAIVVSNNGGGAYTVVDSNWGYDRKVSRHDWTPPGDAQIWRMGTEHISLRSTGNGRYVSAELGYTGNDYAMARARSTGIGGWERFSILGDCSRNCALRSDANGKYLSTELGYQGYAWGEVRARSDQANGWEQFRLTGSDRGWNLLALANSKYVTTELGYTGNGYAMLRARADSPSSWETYTIAY